MIRFIVPGQPKGKQRPRFSKRGKYAHAYTPQATLDYEELIRQCYREQIGDTKMDDVPIKARIQAYFKIPSSYPKRKRQSAVEHLIKPYSKPDVDNICKVVLDALNDVAFTDDRYVTDLVIRKRYAEDPRLEIEISEVKE